MIRMFENHSKHYSNINFNEVTSKIKNSLTPIFNFLQKLDKFKDKLNQNINEYFRDNLLALLIMSKDSGKVIYNHVRDELISPDLIGGFLTAIQDFGNELFSKDSPIRELCYKDFKIKIEDGKYTRVVIVLLDNPNEIFKKSISEKMRDFLFSFELINRKKLENWKCRTDVFDDTDALFQEFFFT
ncbi:MAG: hypothetical protein HWN67_21505 [Candidatus Helarchaeota archaeon]|nr:hypothetical protein [Candidatus Helarchaeota archaeon]